MRTRVEGIGVVGAFGTGKEMFAAALEKGECSPGSALIPTAGGEMEIPVFLADTSGLDEFIPKRALRRVDHYAKLALLAAHLALKDGGCLDAAKEDLGIVVATGYGASATTFAFLDSFTGGNDTFSSPTLFSGSVHNAAAAYLSMFLNITGPCLTVSQFEMSVSSALITARIWLSEKRVRKVLFGAVDEYCRVLGYCRHRFFGGADRTGRIEPFLFDRQTAVPGEGAAFFLLSQEDTDGAYASIVDVNSGHGKISISQKEGSLFILGADGDRDCGPGYASLVTGDMEVASYAPIYGAFPTSQAFDLAAALITERDLVCCIKCGRQGEAGMIDLSRLHTGLTNRRNREMAEHIPYMTDEEKGDLR